MTASVELSAATPVPVDTETTPGEGPMYERGGLTGVGLVVGAEVGGGFGQPFGELGSSFVTELELGFTLPYLKRGFEIFLSGGYTQPKTEGTFRTTACLDLRATS